MILPYYLKYLDLPPIVVPPFWFGNLGGVVESQPKVLGTLDPIHVFAFG
jgi:hypothetical protein